jgi:glyoxylate reductase
MARVVITGKIPAEAVALLREYSDVEAWTDDHTISRVELLRRAAGADALVTLLTEKVDGELLDAAGPQLALVANVAVGYNNIDVSACQARGVVVTNTPRVLTETTADTAFALLLNVTRRFGEGERVIRSRTRWQWGMFFMLGMGIQGKTLGIVGMGQIGVAMARRARAFGMQVVYADDRELPAEVASELEAARVGMDELVAVADVVTLHCPYLPATHHLMSTEQFAAMKPTAYLVNSARGPIIDEEALVEALLTGQIAGAALDVFENEPTVHPGLLEMENVVLFPHLGSATVETRTAMAMLAAENVLAVLDGKAPVTPVTS